MRPETRKKGWLSPLVRGNLCRCIRANDNEGLSSPVRGTASFAGALPAFAGLSPPVRGNPFRGYRPCCLIGSIPACAGEPPDGDLGRGGYRVYPRLCGGTAIARIDLSPDDGLSPPVRGNPMMFSLVLQWRRSIPACAGEPIRAEGTSAIPKVYPRLCGGTWYNLDNAGNAGGLSPPVRGNRGCRPGPGVALRSIPACAG